MQLSENPQQVWNNCLAVIRDIIPQSSFKTWFKPIIPLKLEDNVFTIQVSSPFVYEYIEEHFIDLISKTLRKELGPNVKLQYSVQVVTNENPVTYPPQGHTYPKNKPVPYPANTGKHIPNPFVIPGLKQLQIDPQLNPGYSFSNFIEGECNRLARSAGLTIAERPGGTAFNPLFIYGGSGLGKTHLAQAIGIAVKERLPEKIVLYVSANRFQTQYVDAVTVKNKLNDFLHFYQMIDVLILDDVQEFVGKEGTQNAFFHIFNHLHQSGKQLILTSDKPPVEMEMQGLEKRLLSRFKWGLSAELQMPNVETRIAILQNKIYHNGMQLDDKVVHYIAEKITTNIRELEGALVSLLAQATLNKKAITPELAEETTEKLVSSSQREISILDIQKAVCGYFNLTPESMLSKSRKREIVQARQIAMYLSRNMTKDSLASIGAQIGGKDHATVLHAFNTVCDLMDTDKHFKQYVSEIERQLKETW
ncbi:MAG: chromosomal replication initiator protein DnaA [Prevotellaceae bacterium]|jgi:chromosomal replication initiator protein|nr:chromosomal replication initiator protein DnaA [Prevotellaceae bacterium]